MNYFKRFILLFLLLSFSGTVFAGENYVSLGKTSPNNTVTVYSVITTGMPYQPGEQACKEGSMVTSAPLDDVILDVGQRGTILDFTDAVFSVQYNGTTLNGTKQIIPLGLTTRVQYNFDSHPTYNCVTDTINITVSNVKVVKEDLLGFTMYLNSGAPFVSHEATTSFYVAPALPTATAVPTKILKNPPVTVTQKTLTPTIKQQPPKVVKQHDNFVVAFLKKLFPFWK